MATAPSRGWRRQGSLSLDHSDLGNTPLGAARARDPRFPERSWRPQDKGHSLCAEMFCGVSIVVTLGKV